MFTLDPERFATQLARLLHRRPAARGIQKPAAPGLSYGRHHGPVPRRVRRAAVLVAFCPTETDWVVPLTRRPTWIDHPRQVSFPGGRAEKGETAEQTALREFQEELGPDVMTPRLVGQLTPLYVYVSNNYLTPVVAVLDRLPRFTPDPQEVDEVIEGRASQLMEDELKPHEICRTIRSGDGEPVGNFRFAAPGWEMGGAHVWGATALILNELAGILGELRR